jgi:ATP-binding cassette subfamily F protein uup
MQGTVYEVVERGLSKNKNLTETKDPGELHRHVEKIISQLGLDKELIFNTLSSGRKRQVLLGQALVADPDVLLLDEPTNHLDINPSSDWKIY